MNIVQHWLLLRHSCAFGSLSREHWHCAMLCLLTLWERLQHELVSESRVVQANPLAKDEIKCCNVMRDQVYRFVRHWLRLDVSNQWDERSHVQVGRSWKWRREDRHFLLPVVMLALCLHSLPQRKWNKYNICQIHRCFRDILIQYFIYSLIQHLFLQE